MLSPTGLSINDSRVLQAGSSVTWIPDEELPLTIVGGGNFLSMNTVTETAKADLTNLSGFGNASYRFSNNLSGTVGGSLMQNVAGGSRQISTTQNASISYSGDPLTFEEYSYNWGTGAGISNQTISGGTSASGSRGISAQIQHSLMRSITLSELSSLTANATQSYSLVNNSTSGQNGILTHSAGLSWRHSITERTQGFLSANMSDSIGSGNLPSHYRSWTTQGSFQTQLSSRAALAATLNVSVSQQLKTPETTQSNSTLGTSATISGNNSTTSGAGLLSYTHRSPFDISNLYYSLSVQTTANQTNLRLVSGDPNAMSWQASRVFMHNADYRLGRLTFRATHTITTVNGKKNASLFFMMGRDFGDF
jgi:hypothetical protein